TQSPLFPYTTLFRSIHEWLTLVNTGKIPYQQWEEMFLSQDWYVPNYLDTYYRYFKEYNVVLATYPLFQQGYTKEVKVSSDSWFRSEEHTSELQSREN